MYNPDKWCILKITGDDPHYRVFGSWYGGYLDSDSWRMNSGIVEVKEDDVWYYFYGHSGSCYKCHKDGYGASNYGYSVIGQYTESDKIELLEDSDWMQLDTYIKRKNDER